MWKKFRLREQFGLTLWHKWPELYPAPKAMPRGRSFWVAFSLVCVAITLFTVYFSVYLTTQHDVYLTNAEDLGIMDQAIWSAAQGRPFNQTICNILGDTNCVNLDGVTRYAIHFEPILLLFALFYKVLPSPKTLLVAQTMIVALGALPAFWLARLRLRNNWAAIAIAVLYLLYPALQNAVTYDFHAVTLTAALLMFMFYFMYTRQLVWMFVFALLAMACKEEVPGIVAVSGLWMIVLQKRWRSGLVMVTLSLAWVSTALFAMRLASPTGAPLLAERFAKGEKGSPTDLIFHPAQGIKQYILEPVRIMYMRLLLAPTAYLALLAPWILVIALPVLALNLLSSNPQMHSGLYQYNAEIVPVLIFATIEAIALLLFALQFLVGRCLRLDGRSGAFGFLPVFMRIAILAMVSLLVVTTVIQVDMARGKLPFSNDFAWPQATAHTAIAQNLLDKIPANASVSAQTRLVPHLSHREKIYLFPFGNKNADYILLDVTSDMYPFSGTLYYVRTVKDVLYSGNYGIVAAQDGYILLKRGAGNMPAIAAFSPQKDLQKEDKSAILPAFSPGFCSYTETKPDSVEHPLHVSFSGRGDTMNLVGYSVGLPDTASIESGYVAVDTYWRVSQPNQFPLLFVLFMRDQQGSERLLSFDFPALFWCQTPAWQVGSTVRITSKVTGLKDHGFQTGLNAVSLALVPLGTPYDKLMDKNVRLPLKIQSAPASIKASADNALQLKHVTLTP